MPGINVRSPPRDRLKNVKMIENIIERAVVWQSIEQLSNGSLRLHRFASE